MARTQDLAALLKKLQGEYLSDLSIRDQQALKTYTSGGGGLNLHLRGLGIPEDAGTELQDSLQRMAITPGGEPFSSMESLAERLEKILKEAPTHDEPIEVFRQVEDFYTPEGDLDPAFLSTSTTADAAMDAGDADSATIRQMLKILIEPEDPYLFVPEDFTNWPDELELIGMRNRRLLPEGGEEQAIGSVFNDSISVTKWKDLIKNYRLSKKTGGRINLGAEYA